MSRQGVGRALVVAAALAIAAAVAAAVAVIGTPAQQRDSRLDARRVQDLGRIEAAIGEHAGRHGTLPATLDALAQGTDRALSLADPQTGTRYGYEPGDARRFRLCADFATDSRIAVRRADPWLDGDWQHPAGRHCFQRRLERAAVDDAAAKAAAAAPGR